MNSKDWYKYGIVFLMTVILFSAFFYVSNKLNSRRLSEIRQIENRVSLDLLSREVQFDLLSRASCQTLGHTTLVRELGTLGDRLAYLEDQRGSNDAEVIELKKSYSLLQLRDYISSLELSEKCNTDTDIVLYFYSNADCRDCIKQGYVLTSVRQHTDQVRVYAFDRDLELGAIKTLLSVYGITSDDVSPILVVNEKVHQGFQTLSDVVDLIPSLDNSTSLEALIADEVIATEEE
ncbi:MAG: hypothetical protein OEX08_00845 [Candidatus Nomurabacteria bacterium]|nr:hypothetical protein [Candidatus Nomurabacteria bacterium]